MKTSNKLLLGLISIFFLAPTFLKIAERMCLKLEPPFSVPDFSGSLGGLDKDSSLVAAPGNGVNWTRVTLGLRRSFMHGIINDNSIFNDFGLEFSGNYCTTGHLFKPLSEKTLCWLRFSYTPKKSDTLKYGIPCFSINICKYKEKPESPRMFRNDQMVSNQLESLPGVWNFWLFQSSFCEWSRGLWITTISVPLETCGNDTAKAVELRDRIRDRLFAYYRSLE